ncbi:hypothetical protein [Brachybacterium sacelli]
MSGPGRFGTDWPAWIASVQHSAFEANEEGRSLAPPPALIPGQR